MNHPAIHGTHLFLDSHIINISCVKVFEKATNRPGIILHWQVNSEPTLILCDPQTVWQLLTEYFNWDINEE